MKKANKEIRTLMKLHGIPMWRLAAKIGVHEQTIIRWFRTELTDEKKKLIETALNALQEEIE